MQHFNSNRNSGTHCWLIMWDYFVKSVQITWTRFSCTISTLLCLNINVYIGVHHSIRYNLCPDLSGVDCVVKEWVWETLVVCVYVLPECEMKMDGCRPLYSKKNWLMSTSTRCIKYQDISRITQLVLVMQITKQQNCTKQ